MPRYLKLDEFLETFKQHNTVKIIIHVPFITQIYNKTLLNFSANDFIYLSYFVDSNFDNILHANFARFKQFYTRFYIYNDIPRKSSYYYSACNFLDNEFFHKIAELIHDLSAVPVKLYDRDFCHKINQFVQYINGEKFLSCNIIENEVKLMVDVVQNIRTYHLELTYTTIEFPRLWFLFDKICIRTLNDFVKFVVEYFIQPINKYVEFLYQFSYNQNGRVLQLHMIPKKRFENIMTNYFKTVISNMFEKFENRLIIPNVLVNFIVVNKLVDVRFDESKCEFDEIVDLYKRISDVMF